MFNDSQITEWRDSQLHDYLKSLEDEEIELIKCAGCADMFKEDETESFAMHDYYNGKNMRYCISCIDNYKQDNL